MTREQALVVIWIATMIVLGAVWQRMAYWKRKHDFDHHLVVLLDGILRTTEPTEATRQLVQGLGEDSPVRWVGDRS